MTLTPAIKPGAGIETRNAAERRERLIGVALMCGALLCFTGLDSAAKFAMREGVPPFQTIWVRYAGAMFLSLIVVSPLQWGALVRSARPSGQLLRSLLLLGATVSNFYALRQLQLAETTAIQFSVPLLVALAAGPLLGEWVGPRRLAAICVGFIGVLIVAAPGTAAFKPAMLLAMGNAVFYAFYMITTRAMSNVDAPRTALFWSALAGAVAFTPFMPFVWIWPQTWAQGIALGLVMALGSLGHYLLILAHRRAPAAILAPFIYLQLAFMIASGWMVFGDRPGANTLAGGAVVIACGLYLLARERAVRAQKSQTAAE